MSEPTQITFCLNLYRTVIGPTEIMSGRQRSDIDQSSMLNGKTTDYCDTSFVMIGKGVTVIAIFTVSIRTPQLLNILILKFKQVHFIIGIKHGFSCINIRQVPWEVLKTEAEGRGFQHLPRDLAIVNASKNHVQSLLLHKNWKHLLHFALFLALFCFAFSPMSRERYFHGLCSSQGRAVHISWRQQFCGPGTSVLKVA